MKRYICFSFVLITACFSQLLAQTNSFFNKISSCYDFHPAFEHMDLSLSLGTTGIGFDVATQIGNSVQIRVGYAFMPPIHVKMNFGIGAYADDGQMLSSNFDRFADILKDFMGTEIDKQIDMIGKPIYQNAELLVDVSPFNDKRWHFTAGFYWGPSRIAKAYNTTEDMASLLAVSTYNHLYDYVMEKNFMDEPIYNDFYLDPEVAQELKTKMAGYGHRAIHLGDKHSGEPYLMVPDKNGMVKASVYVNSFKPYLGVGYENALKVDKKYHFSFDCGVMFWGGTPKIVTHDGTNLASDVENIGGKVGRYVDYMKAFKVFPVVNIRISRRIF